MLLVLAAPSALEKELPGSLLDSIIRFQINYAQEVIEHNQDNIVILVDKATQPKYRSLPDDVLLTVQESMHIWTRDYTTINPYKPVEFRYSWATMSHSESIEVQEIFHDFIAEYGLNINRTDYILDGGNIVDNYAGSVITTTRFLEDNNLSVPEGKKVLKALLGAKAVAILEPDEDVMAHADGMVTWLDEHTLLVNDYSRYADFGEEYQSGIIDELESAFPQATIVTVPVQFSDGESSACGINLNAVMTPKALYVPVFAGKFTSNENYVLDTIYTHSSKKVITIEANGVCDQGGSVRCLTWQLTGDNAEKLILAAQRR